MSPGNDEGKPTTRTAVGPLLSEMQRLTLIAGTVSLGLSLDLYKALSEAGPISSAELARRTGCQERWLQEWLRCQAAAEIVDYLGEGLFSLPPEAERLLVAEDNVDSLAPSFNALPERIRTLALLPDVFRKGGGLTWDDRGEGAVVVSEQMNRNIWYRTELVPMALPLLDGIVPRLQEGAVVADVGCGTGSALFAMAEAFPRSHFHGYEVSTLTLERAEGRRLRANLDNIEFHDVRRQPIPGDARFDLILAFDCLHDLAKPEVVIGGIHDALKPDGVWFIEDVDAEPGFEDELKRDRRRAAALYALSLAAGCLASSLSEPEGAGLGTLGLPENKLQQLVRDAGFTRFRRLQISRQSAAFYEVRI